MLEGLNSAAAGMAAQQQRLDAVANDLANANTTGYKHQRVGFRDLVYDQTGRSSAQGVRTGSGAAAVDRGGAVARAHALGGRAAGLLVDEVAEADTAVLVACRVRVREIVGDGVEALLLSRHAGGCGVESFKHAPRSSADTPVT